MRLAIPLLATLLMIAPLAARGSPLDPPNGRIRPMQRDSARLVADGLAQSPTFQRLVERLQRSNVIVYLDLTSDMPSRFGGALRFLARSRTDTFLRIQLNRTLSRRALIALLGHELQHAVEVADAGGVMSVSGLAALYQRLGERTGVDRFDTQAARKIGYAVRHELTDRGAMNATFAMTDDGSLPNEEGLGQQLDDTRQPAKEPPATLSMMKAVR